MTARTSAFSVPDLAAAPVIDRAGRDLLLSLCTVLGFGALFVATDMVERLSPLALRFEAHELDEVLLTACLAVGMAGWFSYRRWRDSARQLTALRSHAAERAFYVERLEALSSQVLSAEEHERNRLADVLHDEVGQTLYAVQLKLELCAEAPAARAAELVREAMQLTSSVMTRTRDLSFQLSPPALVDLGLCAALEAEVPRWQERCGVRVELASGGAWERVPRRFVAAAFHSLQELVLNAAKHGPATVVALRAELDDAGHVQLIVSDDGRGFDQAGGASRGFGLFSIERRTACMHGALELQTAPGGGARVVLRLPSVSS